MEIFNSNGTIAEMCGNGIRCLVKFVKDNKMLSNREFIKVETLNGLITSQISNNNLIS